LHRNGRGMSSCKFLERRQRFKKEEGVWSEAKPRNMRDEGNLVPCKCAS